MPECQVHKTKSSSRRQAYVELTRTIAKQNILLNVVNAHEMVYSDQTGWLPVQSNRGNWLLMVYYDVDANYIDTEPMKDHRDNSMIRACQELWAQTMRNQKEKSVCTFWTTWHQMHLKRKYGRTVTCSLYHQTLTAENLQ